MRSNISIGGNGNCGPPANNSPRPQASRSSNSKLERRFSMSCTVLAAVCAGFIWLHSLTYANGRAKRRGLPARCGPENSRPDRETAWWKLRRIWEADPALQVAAKPVVAKRLQQVLAGDIFANETIALKNVK